MPDITDFELVMLRPDLVVAAAATGIPGYDFDFAGQLQVRHPHDISGCAVIFRCGAVDDYAVCERFCADSGSHPLLSREQHLLASRIDRWYGLIREHTIPTAVFTEFPPYEQVVALLGERLFIKGVRQTARHDRRLSHVRDAGDYVRISDDYFRSDILRWQTIAIRALVDIRRKDNGNLAEFRSFWFDQRCIGLGSYWDGEAVDEARRERLVALGGEVSRRLGMPFLVIDFAELDDGRLVVVECNDAQESGYGGVMARMMWRRLMFDGR